MKSFKPKNKTTKKKKMSLSVPVAFQQISGYLNFLNSSSFMGRLPLA
jgi:hypothetical protein